MCKKFKVLVRLCQVSLVPTVSFEAVGFLCENVMVDGKFTDSDKPAVLCFKNEFSEITEENTYELWPFQGKITSTIPSGTVCYTMPCIRDMLIRNGSIPPSK